MADHIQPRLPGPTWFETAVMQRFATWRASSAVQEAAAAQFLAELGGETRRDPYGRSE